MNRKAILAGTFAIIAWSVMTAFLRSTTENFGHLGGIALIYTLGAILLFVVNRPSPFCDIPKRYLLVGGLMFAAYEICLALAIALAQNHVQVIEVSILNYLWPTLTALLWALNRKKGRGFATSLMLPSILLVAIGTALAVGGPDLLAAGEQSQSQAGIPASYMLALAASAIWAFYTNFTPRMSKGTNATAFFFVVVSLVLWIAVAMSGDWPSIGGADVVSAAAPLIGATLSVAVGYALWNFAINHGDVGILSIISYSAPILSCVASALVLNVAPDIFLWIGVILVSVGSLLGFFARRVVERRESDERIRD
ncbi:MAG TPA: aromatic amino acid DMT transporter YddG [Coriobacteriaceae bacterium]|nr:aromatic amino acid DMT transporter YddG [Coriobacteriaceae bacterium]